MTQEFFLTLLLIGIGGMIGTAVLAPLVFRVSGIFEWVGLLVNGVMSYFGRPSWGRLGCLVPLAILLVVVFACCGCLMVTGCLLNIQTPVCGIMGR
ncbi:MAG: hypothetical protein HS103_04900 [Anaerolineales bacterium]|nr:hypothetical protein [Anaerolineales bacterium]